MATNPQTQQPRAIARPPGEYDDSAAVTTYLDALDHPLLVVLTAIRRTILEADRTITEGIKWKVPSFYCYGWFATTNLRARDRVQIVLHHGAKVRTESTLRLTIDDSAHLLTWLSPDRAIATFTNAEDFQRKQAAFRKIIQQWAEYQQQLARPA